MEATDMTPLMLAARKPAKPSGISHLLSAYGHQLGIAFRALAHHQAPGTSPSLVLAATVTAVLYVLWKLAKRGEARR
jgi:hypothetical protein